MYFQSRELYYPTQISIIQRPLTLSIKIFFKVKEKNYSSYYIIFAIS